jgi:hypothetical protein
MVDTQGGMAIMKRLFVSRWFSIALLLMVFLASASTGVRSTFATPADDLCTGRWGGGHADVYFRRDTYGRLYWDFYLTSTARSELGSPVTVSMPFTYVNGNPINPPYQPHTRENTYNFHSSMYSYGYTGRSGGGIIKTGDRLTFYWRMEGNGLALTKYITCKVPVPGAG